MNLLDTEIVIKSEHFELNETIGNLPSRQLFPSLNDEQWQAVSFNVQSRTQILAGPGTGKTRTLTSRVSYLLRLGVRPENIIVTTFTKKAATEMRERITQLGHNDETINRLKIGTFHYICFRFLKIFGKMIGLSPKVTIADTKDRDDLMKRLLQDPKMEQLLDEVMAKDYKRHFIKYKVTKGVRVYDVDHTTNKISELMSKGVTSVQYAAMADNNRCLSIVYTGYIDLLTASEKLDFDTMLLYTVDLLKQQPQLVDNIEHLLVDEYQDTNPVQLELIYLLAQKSSNITVVGDPDQSIYGFRSADPENFDKMRLYYRDTKILFLQKNYRSTHGILELSTALIQQDTKRVSSERRLIGQVGIDKLRPVYMVKEDDEYFESRFIALNSKGLVEKVGGLFTYNDISILVRSSARMRLIENELNKKAIPYVVVGGLRFWERHEIRVLVDYLRVIYSDFDNLALARILNVPKRGIGDASVKQLKDYEQFGKENMFQLLEYLSDPVHESRKFCLADGQCFNLRPSLRQSILSFVSIINSCRSILEEEDTNGQGQILKMLEFLLSRLQFEKYIKENFPDNYESRIENIKEISKQFEDLLKGGNIKDGFDDFNGLEEESDLRPDSTVTNSSIVLLEQFFTTVNLNAAVDNSPDTSTPAITISTIHASKGLEWPVVYVASCINGVIPHKLSEDMSEERRILFVAMTRARILLYVTGSFSIDQCQGWGANAIKGSHSSFLTEKLRSCMQVCIPKIDKNQVVELASILGRTPTFIPNEPVVTFSEPHESKGIYYNRYRYDESGRTQMKQDFDVTATLANNGNFQFLSNSVGRNNGFKQPVSPQDGVKKTLQTKPESAIKHPLCMSSVLVTKSSAPLSSSYTRPLISTSGNHSFKQSQSVIPTLEAIPLTAKTTTTAIKIEIPDMAPSAALVIKSDSGVFSDVKAPSLENPLISNAINSTILINSSNSSSKAPAYTPVRKPGAKRLGVRRSMGVSKPIMKK